MRKINTLLFSLGSTLAAAQSPNIVLFMVDDMGWQDTSVPFHTDTTANNRKYHTPNMERLASSGMRFTQAYASAVSSPSRCSLLTGSNAARHRVTNWTLKRNETTDILSDEIELPKWNLNGLSKSADIENSYPCTSFVELLRQAGYHTIHCGKAHFAAAETPGENPIHFGFEVNIAGHAAGGPATYLSEMNFGHNPDGTPYSPFAIPGLEKYWGKNIFATEALTLEALAALDKAKAYGQPFFLYLSHYAVHVPVDKDARFYEKYLAQGLDEKEAAYASLVEGMDKSLGDVLDYLDKENLAQNTIVIFMSDNGGLATQPYWRGGELYTQNAPLRCGKGSLLEGGIRVPMMVRWNGVTKANSRCENYLIIEDFFPTILEMAGVKKYKTVQKIDGESFVPLLRGEKKADTRPLIWNYPNIWGNDGPAINLNCAIRQGEHKLIYNYSTGEKELYNIKNDIGEKENLASSRPDLVKKLSKILGKKLREYSAQRPSFKASGRECKWPDEE